MMARCSSVMKALIFLTFSLHLSSAVKHSLQYFYTGVTPGINFPEYTTVGQVDGQQFVYYDSNIRKMIPKTQWIQNNEGEDYWNSETQNMQGSQETFKVGVGTLMQRFNQTTDVTHKISHDDTEDVKKQHVAERRQVFDEELVF
ncbi:hypothetical protein HF521_015010 [Silurus meridionalis]|uniref:MHC class I-like antigen recognition-like domain-containing protein n=1 Tax=Silurus meridionalis TaxID=175797 RepID=A0A8T0A9X8_SILME|nr:hypothetical protein HF521_015010 [Silurus meridionalis]